jgi:hypothetical protein
MAGKSITVRVTDAQGEKLNLLALGQNTTISAIICTLIDTAPTAPIKIEKKGLKLIQPTKANI